MGIHETVVESHRSVIVIVGGISNIVDIILFMGGFIPFCVYCDAVGRYWRTVFWCQQVRCHATKGTVTSF